MLQMLKMTLVFWLISSISGTYAQGNCTELFFSEYIEGAGNNKALEIYNPSQSPIDLSAYSVKIYANGSYTVTNTIPLAGMLAGDSVFVIVNSTAPLAGLKAKADLLSGSLSYNGDDAIALFKGSNIVDLIGVIGVRPAGGGWTTGGVSTVDQTLIRKSTVQIGTGGTVTTFDPSLEYTSLPTDDFSNLGMHTSTCPRCVPDLTPIADAACIGDVYIFNSDTLIASGVYYDTLQNVGGCDSIIELTFTVNPLPTIVASASADTICAGSSVTLSGQGGVAYIWDGSVTDGVAFVPTSTETYTILGQDANGCLAFDSTKVVVVTALTPSISITTADSTLCQGEGTSFAAVVTNGGSNYTIQWRRNGNNVGTGLATYNSSAANTNNGDVITARLKTTGVCGTTIFSNPISITVSAKDSVAIADTICTGESVVLGTQTLTTGGVYFETFTNLAGCDSVVKLTLIEHALPTIIANSTADTICSGASITLTGQGGALYIWNNSVNDGVAFIPAATATYKVIGKDVNGCLGLDSVKVVVETALAPSISIATPDSTLCTGEGTTFTSTVTNGGVNSVIQWKRNGNNVGSGLTSYTSQAANTNNGDVITAELTTTGACASTVVSNPITLTVSTKDSVAIADTICAGESVVLGAQTLTVGGVYYETFTNQAGCDSVVKLTLVEYALPLVVAAASEDTLCFGAGVTLTGAGATTYTWSNGAVDGVAFVPTSTSTYVLTGVDANGCTDTDSIEVYVSNVAMPTIQITTPDSTLCTGEGTSFTSIVTNAGVNYAIQWKRNGNNVGTGLASYTSQAANTTNGDVITVKLTTTGTCATTVYSNPITLTVNSTDTVNLTSTICSGDTIVLGAQSLTSAGNYSEVFSNVNGCDSVVNMEIFVNPISITTINDTICEGQPYQFAGQAIVAGGVYYDSLQTTLGCDSIVSLVMVVNPIERTTQTQTVCFGDSFLFGGVQLTATGTYYDTLTNAKGCDSISTLQLVVGTGDTIQAADIICSGDTVAFGSQFIYQTGVYTEVFTSTAGCDSVVTMTLEVLATSSSQLAATICENDTVVFAGQALTTSGIYYDTLVNAEGCDSLITFTLVVNPIAIDSLVQEVCAGESVTFGGAVLTQSGVYSDSLQTVNGCDSVTVLTLTVFAVVDTTVISATICNGTSYVLGTQTITQAGTYSELFQNALGCDSVVTAIVGIGNSNNTDLEIDICEGEFYSFGSQVLTTSGTYSETFTNAVGCDSVVDLTLNVKVKPIVSITLVGDELVATEGDTYQWFLNGDTIPGATDRNYTPTENGVYKVIMTAFNGCSDGNNYTILNVSITEVNNVKLVIAPNPSKGMYQVSAVNAFSYTVYNLLGEVVESNFDKVSTQNIDLTNKENGIYILEIITENQQVIVERLVKN